MITATKMAKKVVGSQIKGEALKGTSLEISATNINMVSFISSRFWVSINQSNSLIGNVFVKDVEWTKLFEDTTVKPTIM